MRLPASTAWLSFGVTENYQTGLIVTFTVKLCNQVSQNINNLYTHRVRGTMSTMKKLEILQQTKKTALKDDVLEIQRHSIV